MNTKKEKNTTKLKSEETSIEFAKIITGTTEFIVLVVITKYLV